MNGLLGKTYRLASQGEAAQYLEQARSPLEGLTRLLGDPDDWYCLALVRALQGKPHAALEALRKAHAAGFRNAGRVEAEEAFQPLRGNRDYQEMLARMKRR